LLVPVMVLVLVVHACMVVGVSARSDERGVMIKDRDDRGDP
jgi:hypothetical protein